MNARNVRFLGGKDGGGAPMGGRTGGDMGAPQIDEEENSFLDLRIHPDWQKARIEHGLFEIYPLGTAYPSLRKRNDGWLIQLVLRNTGFSPTAAESPVLFAYG